MSCIVLSIQLFFLFLRVKLGLLKLKNIIKTSVTKQKSYFEGLAKSLSEIVILIDPKTFQIQFINKTHPSRRLEDIIGKEVFTFITAEHIDLYKQMLHEVVSNLKPTTIDLVGNSENATGKSWYRSLLHQFLTKAVTLKTF